MGALPKSLDKLEFINVATADTGGQPNAAPKFLLKVVGRAVYLVDYTIGRTWKNLRENPRVSLSYMEHETLTGYQLNGSVKIISSGAGYEKMRDEMTDKEIRLTAKHIIEDVAGKSKHEHFEVGITERFIILKVTVDEVTAIGHRGDIVRKHAD